MSGDRRGRAGAGRGRSSDDEGTVCLVRHDIILLRLCNRGEACLWFIVYIDMCICSSFLRRFGNGVLRHLDTLKHN